MIPTKIISNTSSDFSVGNYFINEHGLWERMSTLSLHQMYLKEMNADLPHDKDKVYLPILANGESLLKLNFKKIDSKAFVLYKRIEEKDFEIMLREKDSINSLSLLVLDKFKCSVSINFEKDIFYIHNIQNIVASLTEYML